MQSNEKFRTICVDVKPDYMKGTWNWNRPLDPHSSSGSWAPASCSVSFPLFSVCLPAHQQVCSIVRQPPSPPPRPPPQSPAWSLAGPPHPWHPHQPGGTGDGEARTASSEFILALLVAREWLKFVGNLRYSKKTKQLKHEVNTNFRKNKKFYQNS